MNKKDATQKQNPKDDSVMIGKLTGLQVIEYLSGEDEKELLKANTELEEFVKKNSGYIKYAQIRTLHKAIKDAKNKSELLKTMPLLAYIQGRQEKDAKTFVKIIRISINEAIKSEEIDIDSIHNFIDAIVAYHKLYGKNN